MATEVLDPQSYVTPTSGSEVACSPIDADSSTCESTSTCALGTLKRAGARHYNFETPVYQAYYSQLQLTVDWWIGELDVPDSQGQFCSTKSVRLEYTLNGGTSWLTPAGWPKTPTASGTQSGTKVIAISGPTSQDISKVRVRLITEAAASSCPSPPLPETHCEVDAKITDVFLTGTYTLPTGACCSGLSCVVTDPISCGGVYQGDSTTCSPNPCDPVESCCESGICSETTEAACSGTWGEAPDCSPNPCDPLGACCVGETCTSKIQSECGGTWQGAGSVCSPNPCESPDTGACCTGATCSVTTVGLCGGVYLGTGTTCSPDPCASNPSGACCNGASCSVVQQDSCTGTFLGSGTTCSGDPCAASEDTKSLLACMM